MKVLGIVILYYPDDKVKQNILSYLPRLDKLIIWENTPEPALPLSFDTEAEEKLLRMGCGKNTGIGTPLNEAVRFGQENGFTHLLTMDQDSCFGENMFAGFLRALADGDSDNVASFSANTHPYEASQPTVEEINICITSGTIYTLEVFKDAGSFRDDFFIDAIDTEFCFRLRRKGWKMVQLNHIHMHHVLGNVTVTPFLWGKLISPNYSAQRTYYLTRNSLLLKRLYPEYKQAPGLFKTLLFWRPLCLLFAEQDKWRKFKAMCLGIYHSLKKRTGEYVIH